MRRAALLLAAAFAAAGLAAAGTTSCSRLKEVPPGMTPPAAPSEPAPGAAPAATPASAPAPAAAPGATPAASPADRTYAEGAAALLEGNFERALDRFEEAWKESPGHAGVLQDHREALNGLRKSADEAYRNGRFEDAGRAWASLLRHMGHPAAKSFPPPFARADVQGKVDRMTAMLMEKAIVEYRQGSIEAAIALWKSILAYDPSHKEAAQSLKTATTQIENLKKIPPPPK